MQNALKSSGGVQESMQLFPRHYQRALVRRDQSHRHLTFLVPIIDTGQFCDIACCVGCTWLTQGSVQIRDLEAALKERRAQYLRQLRRAWTNSRAARDKRSEYGQREDDKAAYGTRVYMNAI